MGQADGVACRTVEMFNAFGICARWLFTLRVRREIVVVAPGRLGGASNGGFEVPRNLADVEWKIEQ